MAETAELHESSADALGRRPESAELSESADEQQGDLGVGDLAGTGSSAATFPVDTFRAAAMHLRRPFTDKAVKWKVQTGTLVVPYIDARLAIERLNLVCPHLWHDEYESLAGGNGLLCRLTVDGITRQDVGSGYKGKGLYSDAFKRAAVKFGIGVSLYALPKVFLDKGKGFLTDKGLLTDKGEDALRRGYAKWLEETGEMFGKPLDHGDVLGAYGDVEAETAPPIDLTPEEPEAKPLEDERAKNLIARAEELQAAIPSKKLTKAAFNRQLASVSHSHEDLEKFIARLEEMAS